MGNILAEVRTDLENQVLRRVEGGKVRLFQLRVHDAPQQV